MKTKKALGLVIVALLLIVGLYKKEIQMWMSPEAKDIKREVICMQEIRDMTLNVASVDLIDVNGEVVTEVQAPDLGYWVDFLNGLNHVRLPSLKVATMGFVRFTSVDGYQFELSICTGGLVACQDEVWFSFKDNTFDLSRLKKK